MGDKFIAEPCKINRAEVIRLMKSDGVRALVAAQGVILRNRANKAARGHGSPETDEATSQQENEATETKAPYRFRMKIGSFDTLGIVETATRAGAIDENQHHTLESLIH